MELNCQTPRQWNKTQLEDTPLSKFLFFSKHWFGPCFIWLNRKTKLAESFVFLCEGLHVTHKPACMSAYSSNLWSTRSMLVSSFCPLYLAGPEAWPGEMLRAFHCYWIPQPWVTVAPGFSPVPHPIPAQSQEFWISNYWLGNLGGRDRLGKVTRVN